MNRHAIVVAFALCLSPSLVRGQTAEFTVNAVSADVHKSASTGSPIIGSVPRGTVLEVTRELGSWVKISWARAEDGVGYVHVSTGSIIERRTPAPTKDVGLSAQPQSPSGSSTTTAVRVDSAAPASQPANSIRSTYIVPPAHIVGLGGRISESTFGFGATTREWSRHRVGVQLDLSHNALTAAPLPGRVTAIQLVPSVLFSLGDHVTDVVWVRPYLGAGAGLLRETFSSLPNGADAVSNNSLGVHTFGGAEFTFANAPRFAVSTDLGYRWLRTPFAGFELGGVNVSMSVHWYLK